MYTNTYTNQVAGIYLGPTEKPTQCYPSRKNADSQSKSSQVKSQGMSLNDLEFAYAPVRDQVRDLREYL